MSTLPLPLCSRAQSRGRPLWFAFSGAIATASHWGVMILLVLAGLSATTSTASGSLCGAVINYLLQYRLVFRCQGRHRYALMRYMLSCLFAAGLNLAFFGALQGDTMQGVATAQLLATAIVAATNYFIYKRLVFHA